MSFKKELYELLKKYDADIYAGIDDDYREETYIEFEYKNELGNWENFHFDNNTVTAMDVFNEI